MNSIICKSVKELLSALNADTSIQLASGHYDISDIVLPYDKNVFYTDDGIGPNGDRELILRNISDMEIHGEDSVRVTSRYQYANVITFVDCSNIILDNVIFGHFPEMGGCRGGVLVFINCQNITIKNCTLFGCGTIGLACVNCKSVYVDQSVITKCNSEILYLDDSEECIFTNTKMIQNETRVLKILHCDQIVFRNCSIKENNLSEWDNGTSFLFTIANSCGSVIVDASEIDIPEGHLVNRAERLTLYDNNKITDDFIYG